MHLLLQHIKTYFFCMILVCMCVKHDSVARPLVCKCFFGVESFKLNDKTSNAKYADE